MLLLPCASARNAQAAHSAKTGGIRLLLWTTVNLREAHRLCLASREARQGRVCSFPLHPRNKPTYPSKLLT